MDAAEHVAAGWLAAQRPTIDSGLLVRWALGVDATNRDHPVIDIDRWWARGYLDGLSRQDRELLMDWDDVRRDGA